MKSRLTLIFIFCFALNGFGQSADSIERDISQSLGRAVRTFMANDWSVAQQAPAAYASFVTKLLHYTSTSPSTLKYTFLQLHWPQMTILTSDDSLFRVYSWPAPIPGNVFQWKSKNTTISMCDTLQRVGEYCVREFTVHTRDKDYYLCIFNKSVRDRVARQRLTAFVIQNGKLVEDVQFFKTRDGGLSSVIELDIAYSPIIRPDKWENESAFTFDAEKLTIESPKSIDSKDNLIGHIVYKFNGKYFEQVKN
jgi:hypothetical protein